MIELNKIFNEDCMVTMERIPSGSIDLILTDPPYNITNCEWDKPIDLIILWAEWERILKPEGIAVFTAAQPFTSELIMSKRDWFKYEMIWQKNKPSGFFNGQKQPLKAHENILVFYKKFSTYNPQMIKRTPYEFKQAARVNDSVNHFGEQYGKGKANPLIRKPIEEQWYRLPDTVLKFDKDDLRDGSQHPTQKPLDLFRWLVKTYSNEGDVVFDGYMGSGTTAIACVKEKRNYIGAELNKEYFDMATKRINEYKAQTVLF